jgi:hypothetical protein
MYSKGSNMTLPDERYRSVVAARKLLEDIAYGKIPRVPKEIKARAHGVLRHYPSDWDMDRAAEKSGNVFAKSLDPLYKMVLQKSLEDQVDKDLG